MRACFALAVTWAIFTAGATLAQDIEMERHIAAAAVFTSACVDPAPDLAGSRDAMVEAGLTPDGEAFVGFGESVIGFLSAGEDGRTRTCAVGLAGGSAELMIDLIGRISEALWGEAGNKFENETGSPVFVRQDETFVATMTVAAGNPTLPVMNHVSFAPGGFSE